MWDEELLPCPFCGSDRVDFWDTESTDHPYQIICIRCCNGTDRCRTEEIAIKKWNTRKPMERIVARLEEMFKHHSVTKTVQRLVLETVKDWWCR